MTIADDVIGGPDVEDTLEEVRKLALHHRTILTPLGNRCTVVKNDGGYRAMPERCTG